MVNAGNALANCGEISQAQTIIAELPRRSQTDTVLNKILLPLVQARIELQRGNPAQALQLLETAFTVMSSTIPAGARFGRYESQPLLGTGGMGEVYQAQDTKLDRKVSLGLIR